MDGFVVERLDGQEVPLGEGCPEPSGTESGLVQDDDFSSQPAVEAVDELLEQGTAVQRTVPIRRP
ncbi:hypothetical protein [Streptomyces zhihengii]